MYSFLKLKLFILKICISLHDQKIQLFLFDRTKYQSKIIDGKKIASQIQTEIKYDIQKWLAKGNRGPHLSVLLVGDNPASAVYVNNKLKAAQKTGNYKMMMIGIFS